MYNFKKAIFLVILSTLIISGIPWGIFTAYTYLWSFRIVDPRFEIKAIQQETGDRDPLKSAVIAEILGLSVDHPINLYQLDLRQAKTKLERFPVIKEAELKRGYPDFLYLKYTMRKPFAKLGDVSNTVIDEEGVLFPFAPFFSPKKLPTFIFGKDENLQWGEKISKEKLILVKQVLEELEKLNIAEEAKIDASSAYELSLGEQKVIVILRENEQTHYICLDPQEFKDGLKRYQLLKKKINLNGMVDLRLPQLGYIVLIDSKKNI